MGILDKTITILNQIKTKQKIYWPTILQKKMKA